MSTQSRQLAAIMFTDIVGYTALMGSDEKKAFQSLSYFKSIAQPLVEKFYGKWHKDLGDGALMSFSNVQDAVHCGIAIQKEINSKADFRLRIGLHLGDITYKDGDVFGDGVNIASRIQSEAAPGGICISESIAKNIRNQDGMKAEYFGKRLLKNVDEPVVLYQLSGDGLIVHSKRQTKKISLTAAVLLIIATALITAGLVWQQLRPGEKENPLIRRFNINLPAETPLEFIGSSPFGGGQTALTVSPYGEFIVYAGPYKNTTALYSRNLSSSQTELLPGTEGAYNPFFSPDGKWIGFFANSFLKKTGLDKRAPTELCRANETWGACWTTNGKIIFSALDGNILLSIDETGGEPENITPVDKKSNKPILNFGLPSALPGGKHILISNIFYNIYIVSPETNEITQLPIRGIQPVYIPSGHITYMVNGSMFAVSFDIKKMEITGKPYLVQDGLRTDSENTPHFGFDQKGNMIYAPGISNIICRLVWVDQNGKEDSLPFQADFYGITSISPDGKKIAYTQTGVNGELISLDLSTGRRTVLNRTGFSQGVRWQADNNSIGFSSTYQSNQTQEQRLFSITETTGQIKPLFSGVDSIAGSLFINDFSKDSMWVSFQMPSANNGEDIWIKNLSKPEQPAKPLIKTNSTEWGLRFSPKSQFIAFTSNSSGRYEVYVQGFPNAGEIKLLSNGGGEEPVWTSSGRQVIYRNGRKWWIVDVIANDGKIQPSAPRFLFEGPYLNCPGPSFDIAPDGRLLVLKPITEQHSTTELIVIENWFEELKRLAPAK